VDRHGEILSTTRSRNLTGQEQREEEVVVVEEA